MPPHPSSCNYRFSTKFSSAAFRRALNLDRLVHLLQPIWSYYWERQLDIDSFSFAIAFPVQRSGDLNHVWQSTHFSFHVQKSSLQWCDYLWFRLYMNSHNIWLTGTLEFYLHLVYHTTSIICVLNLCTKCQFLCHEQEANPHSASCVSRSTSFSPYICGTLNGVIANIPT